MEHHRAVALVGGGGKTSTLYALAHAAYTAGKTVVVTTTTHIMPHPRIALTSDADPARLTALLARERVVTLGRFGQPDKLSGVGELQTVKRCADVVLLEADGARQLPLKAPKEGEPVLPPGVDAVVAIAGMDSVGFPIGSICHRADLVCALLGKPPSAAVTPRDVAKLLSSPHGGRKCVEETTAFRCILNKADTPERRAAAAEIAGILALENIHCLITRYAAGERGGKGLF